MKFVCLIAKYTMIKRCSLTNSQNCIINFCIEIMSANTAADNNSLLIIHLKEN